MSELAIKLVKKCLETQDPYLNLENCNLEDVDFKEKSEVNEYLRKCEHVTTLSLLYNNITKISGLECLSELQRLFVSHNRISEISGLEQLSKLKELYLNFNEISAITGLESVTSLEKLYLSSNQIQSLRGLENLSALQQLYISNNYIRSLNGLENLKSLQQLHLNNNQIKALNGIENLNHLKQLYVNYNQIQSLDGIESLASLLQLNVRNNQIQSLKGIERVVSLTHIDIRDNKINNIKPLVYFLGRDDCPLAIVLDYSRYSHACSIYLENNPLTIPPKEIVYRSNKDIVNYFKDIEEQGIEYLYEAKMLIVGQPRAGKTSLRRKLSKSSSELPTEDKTTRGIDIERLKFDIVDIQEKQRDFYYYVWDFGGQQIYQTTHQFFLSSRSLYILVLDTGNDNTGNDDNIVNYWLQVVELLGSNSPLLIVKNVKNKRTINIDIDKKRERFPFIRNDYEIDLNALIPNTTSFEHERLRDFTFLKKNVENELSHLPLVGFAMPKNWVQIRNELQELSFSKPYITRQDYINICNLNNVTTFDRQMELSMIFHDLGIFLHFQKYGSLEDFIILQNTWATDAVFAVLDNEVVQENKGRFSFDDLSTIWKGKLYEPEVHSKLLYLMMQFELCYHLEKSNPGVYIIPEMLADAAPIGCTWQLNNDILLQYRYDFMPKGILTRLIVRLHRTISLYKGKQVVWKTGIKIDGKMLDCPNSEAEITEAWNNKQLYIRAHGSFAKDLITRVSQEIDQLNNEYFRQVSKDESAQKSRWYKMVPCNCVICRGITQKHFYKYEDLTKRKAFGKDTIECEKEPFQAVNITELLDGVFATKLQGPKESDVIDIFVSYSNKDRELRELLVDGIKSHLDNKTVKYKLWSDTAIDMGANWKAEIDKALQESKVAIILVSASFAASKFIKEYELAEFFKKKKEDGYLILPVLIRNYNFEEFEEISSLNFFKSHYKDYGYNKPIERNRFLAFDVLGENEHATEKQLQDYYQKLAEYIHTAVTNHLKSYSIKNPPSSIE
jgi:internalin A